ncbi:exodeoxyribonuclease VII large subunit [Blastomonas marina]|jgi:exodeoxyribonuclease VII large subunit|uniref:exodeoxyribonuclease VII large subunit n=1 Tax=Blastomonas marina TaxID=1867408 RepID=UPI002AC979CC|nr:exodeoxyribonuclease VII large subunit [Blastomonas marina]WPZ03554.1 exodeoxyribonuclease VII large subunit [Blastomonas marina]
MPANPPFDDTEDNSNAPGLVASARAGDNAEPFSVSEISAQLKRTVEDRFGFVRIRGELSGVKRAASGHLYASLKDDKARIDAVMWRGSVDRLAFQPEDGLEVVASGKLTTYPGRSNYQIVIERMEVAGEGALLALLEKTKQRLGAEGLFDAERKRRLPLLPCTIGVVTSPTGSVIRDILHRLADRFPSHVMVWPVIVQGKGSAEQVAAAVRGFGAIEPGGALARPDVLIVARGGGSIEDLWGFNEEVVARAIAESPIPVISAVGHETDTTLADFAADKRAPTPTAAAEMAVPVRAELAGWISELGQRQRAATGRTIDLGKERLAARTERLPDGESLLQPYAQRLDELAERLRRGLVDRARTGRERLAGLRLSPAVLEGHLRQARHALAAQRLAPQLVLGPLARRRESLAALARLAEQLHPDKPLARGYVRVMAGDGATLTSAAGARKADLLHLKFADGIVDAVPQGRSPPVAHRPKRAKPSAAGQEDLFG